MNIREYQTLHVEANQCKGCYRFGVWAMVINATFNNISAISWGSLLLVVEYPKKTTDL